MKPKAKNKLKKGKGSQRVSTGGKGAGKAKQRQRATRVANAAVVSADREAAVAAERAAAYQRALALVMRSEEVLEQEEDDAVAHGKAKKLLKRSIKECETVEACNALGMLYLDVGDGTSAVKCFSRAMALDPSDFLAYSKLADVLAVQGDMEGAAKYLTRCTELLAARLAPGSGDESGDESSGRGADAAAAELGDVYAVAAEELVDVYKQLHKPLEAVNVLKEAVTVVPEHAELWLLLATTALGEHQVRLAHGKDVDEIGLGVTEMEAALNKGMALCKAHGRTVPADAQYSLGQLLLLLKRVDDAVEVLEGLVAELEQGGGTGESDDEDAGNAGDEDDDEVASAEEVRRTFLMDALYLLGQVYFENKEDHIRAEHRWQMIIDRTRPPLTPPPHVHSALAMLLASQGQWQGALSHLDIAVRLGADVAHFHASRGDVLMELGEVTRAREAYAKACKLAPNDEDIRARAAKAAGGAKSAGKKKAKKRGAPEPAGGGNAKKQRRQQAKVAKKEARKQHKTARKQGKGKKVGK